MGAGGAAPPRRPRRRAGRDHLGDAGARPRSPRWVSAIWLLKESDRIGQLTALGLTLLAFVILGPVVQPWYLTWGLILLAPVAEGRIRTLVIALSVVSPFIGLPGGRELRQPAAARRPDHASPSPCWRCWPSWSRRSGAGRRSASSTSRSSPRRPVDLARLGDLRRAAAGARPRRASGRACGRPRARRRPARSRRPRGAGWSASFSPTIRAIIEWKPALLGGLDQVLEQEPADPPSPRRRARRRRSSRPSWRRRPRAGRGRAEAKPTMISPRAPRRPSAPLGVDGHEGGVGALVLGDPRRAAPSRSRGLTSKVTVGLEDLEVVDGHERLGVARPRPDGCAPRRMVGEPGEPAGDRVRRGEGSAKWLSSPGRPLTDPSALVAQWQSTSMVRRGSWVQSPPRAPWRRSSGG